MIVKSIIWLIFSKCQIQTNLKYNMSNRPIPEGLPVYNPNATLAEVICCDKRYQGLAEPRYTFNQSDVDLFSYLNESGDNYFYDASCGLPLFVVPRERTLADFKKETLTHGWPSFHDSEVINQSIRQLPNSNHVVSKCGTQLGDNLPEKGHNRYCLDLVCVSGHSHSN